LAVADTGAEGQSVEGQSAEGASPEGASPEGQNPDVEEGRSVANIGVRRRYGDEETAEVEAANKRRRVEEIEGMEKIRRAHERQERRRSGLAMEEAEVGDRMEGQFRFWQARCEICQIKEQVSEGHQSWRDCRDGEAKEAVRRVWGELSRIRFEAYTGCFDCWAPQGICQAWEAVENGGRSRYRRARGGRCQFPGVLRDTVAAVVGVGRAELMEEFVEAMAAKERVELDDSYGAGVGRWMPWLRRKVRIGEIETSGLGRMFWELSE
jgi:hypothetical protein